MTAFHAFVTGLAGRYSDIKQEQRNLAGQEKLAQLELEKQSIASGPQTKKYGNMTYMRTDPRDLANDDLKAFQAVADYANMLDGASAEDIASLSDAERKELEMNVKGTWSAFTALQSPGTGGSGDNLKEYYRIFPNLDAFTKLPDLHEYMLSSDPTKSITGDITYDTEHEILGIGNNEQGTPAIFKPEDEESFKQESLTGNATNVPNSLIMTPKKLGGKYDFGGPEKEKQFYSDINSILTSRQFGGMQDGEAQALMNNKSMPWAGLAVYAAYGYSTGGMDAQTFGKEMAELQAIYGIDDEKIMMVASRGLMKYTVSPNAGNTRALIERKNSDYTDQQQKAIDNAAQQSTLIREDLLDLIELYEKGVYKTGPLGPLESLARGVFTDEGSITNQLKYLSEDSVKWTNFEGVDGAVKGNVAMGARTMTTDSKQKGSLAWHVAGLEESIRRDKTTEGKDRYWDYDKNGSGKGGWVRKTKQGQGEGYRARKILEISLAYRLTVLEQGSGGNTISDKDFAKSLGRIQSGLLSSKEQVIDGLKKELQLASRGMITTNIQASNPYNWKVSKDLRYLYGHFRTEKQNLWSDIDRQYNAFYGGGANKRIDSVNEVMANRVSYLRNNLNFTLGVMEKGKGLYEDLSEKEMAWVLDDAGFFKNVENKSGTSSNNPVTSNNETNNNDNIVSGNLEGMTVANEQRNQLAGQGYINLPAQIDKRPTKVIQKPFGLFEDDLETVQKQWDTQYGQWYNEDGSLRDGVSEIPFEDLNKLFKDKKSKIIKLLQNRVLPRPDDLPLQVPAKPTLAGDANVKRNQKELDLLKISRRNWELKYGKYYNPDGTLILHPEEANKSLTTRVKETF